MRPHSSITFLALLAVYLAQLTGHAGAKRSPVLLQTGGFPDDQYSFNSSRGLLEVENSNGQAHTPLAPIVLVGNGPSVLQLRHINGSNLGAIIDSYPEVGRFNLHRTRGFERLVGSKTSVCFMGQLKHPTKNKPKCPRYIVPVVKANGVSRNKIKQGVKRYYSRKGMANKLEIMTDHIQKALKNKYKLKAGPSTGIQAIVYCAQKYKKVAIAGFDFLHGNHKHYFEKKKKKRTTHNMKGEAQVILQLEKEGKLFRLY